MDPVRFYDDGKKFLTGRDSFTIAVFAEVPFQTMATEAKQIFDDWMRRIPKGVLEWSRVGANSTSVKKFNESTLARCYDQMNPTRAAQRELSYVYVAGGEDLHNPSYSFSMLGYRATGGEMGTANLIEMRFASEFPEIVGWDSFVDWMLQAVSKVPFDSGYASPALHRGWENAMHVILAGEQLIPIAFRYPGFDLSDNKATSFALRRRSRGARWLTFLGPEQVKRLGGAESLRASLSSAIDVVGVGAGLALRAGPKPELGDVNRGDHATLLREVARAIEPVTLVGDTMGLLNLFNGDEGRLLRWERRNLD